MYTERRGDDFFYVEKSAETPGILLSSQNLSVVKYRSELARSCDVLNALQNTSDYSEDATEQESSQRVLQHVHGPSEDEVQLSGSVILRLVSDSIPDTPGNGEGDPEFDPSVKVSTPY